ncbi:ATP-binding protein [Magnetovibrio sp. PR-2]|uniref:ATP-binding protein n=1 Tax=Magnetovibrio sp. PR-2 TaxID=3120356 RepID=UPI002FCE01F3
MQKTWGFYGRNSELEEIETIISSGRWFFCAISGRRRIGKTTLIQQALRRRQNQHYFYFQVPDSDERGVVQAFWEAAEDIFDDHEGMRAVLTNRVRSFQDMAEAIDGLCAVGFIIIIDEFQYFHRKALSPFASFLQSRVDEMRNTNKGGLFVLGSIHTEMTAILEDQASPLFNRVTHRLHLDHWDFETFFEMCEAQDVQTPEHWLFLWSLFEGVPKFYRDAFDQGVLADQNEYRQTTLRKLFFEGASPLRDEATNWFLRELRGRYDSVLKMLANKGPCTRGTLEDEYDRDGVGGEKQLGAYLTTLIDRYQMVEKLQPIFASNKSRKARYVITDNFLSAWLRALGRNVQMARVQPVAKPLARADEMLMVHEGYAFEKMIRILHEESSRKGVGDFALTDFVYGYWNKADGSDVVIDIVTCNEDDKILRLGSCKRNQDSHDGKSLEKFQLHISRFLKSKEGRRFDGWSVEHALFSPRFDEQTKSHLQEQGYICRDLNDYKETLYPKQGPNNE